MQAQEKGNEEKMIYNSPSDWSKKNTGIRFSPFKIAWLFPDGSYENPSNRLRRYQINNYFNNLETIQSKTFVAGEGNYLEGSPSAMCEFLEKFDVVVIFNVASYDAELSKLLVSKGKIVVFDHCENIFGLGAEDEIMRSVSAITCCSSSLADNTERYLHSNLGIDKPIFVIHDPVDNSAIPNLIDYALPTNRALIMAMGANVQYVFPFLEGLCKKTDYEIFIITERGFNFPYSTKIWGIHNWAMFAATCSIALCYHDIYQFPAKGNVKVTNPMSIGLPVIAPPMNSYMEAITNGYDGFISDTEEGWIKNMEALKDPNLRRAVGIRAHRSAFEKYGVDKIALDYLTMIGILKK